MSKRKATSTITESLKTAIEQSGLTRYQISKDTGIAQAALAERLRLELERKVL